MRVEMLYMLLGLLHIGVISIKAQTAETLARPEILPNSSHVAILLYVSPLCLCLFHEDVSLSGESLLVLYGVDMCESLPCISIYRHVSCRMERHEMQAKRCLIQTDQ